jgi:hypothetical protein
MVYCLLKACFYCGSLPIVSNIAGIPRVCHFQNYVGSWALVVTLRECTIHHTATPRRPAVPSDHQAIASLS